MKQLLLDIAPSPAPTLDNFVPGRNAEVLHTLRQVVAGSAEFRFVMLWGAEGSGKSHLLQASANLAHQHGVHLLTSDDVQNLDETSQIELFNTYNRLRDGGGALIAAGNDAPNRMGLRDDLSTRLSWGLVYQLHPLDDSEKSHALKAHATERGIKLSEEVIEYCQRHLRRDLPTLMATLDALDKWSLTEKKPVTVPSLKRLLQLPLDY